MPKQKQKTTTQLRGPKRSVGYLVLPALCLSALAVFLPMLLTIIVSFTDWNGVANLKELNFIGLRNFTDDVLSVHTGLHRIVCRSASPWQKKRKNSISDLVLDSLCAGAGN